MAIHRVKQGEHIQLIAKRFGVPWKKIWDDPENQALKDSRKTPDILYPGDTVFIPDKESNEESIATGQRYRFRVKQAAQKLRLYLNDDFGEPLAGVTYRLWIPGGKTIQKVLGDDGIIEEDIPVEAQSLKLTLDEMNVTYNLKLGALNPVGRVSGVQQRLQNLGYAPGRADNIVGPKTRSALIKFQITVGLPVTGMADKKTRLKLEQAHDGLNRGAGADDNGGVAVNFMSKNEGYGSSDDLDDTLPDYEVHKQGDE